MSTRLADEVNAYCLTCAAHGTGGRVRPQYCIDILGVARMHGALRLRDRKARKHKVR